MNYDLNATPHYVHSDSHATFRETISTGTLVLVAVAVVFLLAGIATVSIPLLFVSGVFVSLGAASGQTDYLRAAENARGHQDN